ncbi:RraA family protein [Cupriavidus necator]
MPSPDAALPDSRGSSPLSSEPSDFGTFATTYPYHFPQQNLVVAVEHFRHLVLVGAARTWSGASVRHGTLAATPHVADADVFLEAIERSNPGDVLVVDNGGRRDEACVGDLVTLEASEAGLSGIVIWGLHRDSSELRTIRLPLFSLGALPAGPQRLDTQDSPDLLSATIGQYIVTPDDFVLGDDDGVIFVPLERAAEVTELATTIRDTERLQAARMQLGTTFRRQARFDEYLAARRADPSRTFRQHLRSIGGAVEE